MKSNNSTSFIIFTGVLVLSVFTAIIFINLLSKNNQSDSYYVKIDDEISAKIEKLDIKDNRLYIKTLGDAVYYCIKSTKSKPSSNNICWKKIKNNHASVSVYKNKKYYIWIKDVNENISSPISIHSTR